MCTIAPTFAFTFDIKYPCPSHLIVQEIFDVVYTRGLYVVVLVMPVGLRSRAAFYCYRRPLLEGGIWAGNPSIMYATEGIVSLHSYDIITSSGIWELGQKKGIQLHVMRYDKVIAFPFALQFTQFQFLRRSPHNNWLIYGTD